MRKRSLTRQVGVVLSEESHNKLIRVTDQKEVPISKFVRELVEAKLNSIDNQEEISNDANE